ncbi:MAG: hypothetical protein ACXVXC_01510 [Nocardioidaceae bacterium]
MPEAFLGVVILGVVLWLVVRLVGQTTAGQLGRPEREELLDLRGLVDDLKETAWEHRELDSPLATIIIDKIRTYEHRRREQG